MHGLKTAARGPLKLKDFVKLLRRELSLAEEAVPWALVDSRWRAQRRHWQRRVRQADSVQVRMCVGVFVRVFVGALLEGGGGGGGVAVPQRGQE